jgi:hypothetical protein
MATLTIELSDEILAQLQTDAKQQGKVAEVVAQELITQQLEAKQVSKMSDRDLARKLLKDGGKLSTLHPDLLKLANSAISIEEIRDALSRDGKPMSEIVIEQRGPLY